MGRLLAAIAGAPGWLWEAACVALAVLLLAAGAQLAVMQHRLSNARLDTASAEHRLQLAELQHQADIIEAQAVAAAETERRLQAGREQDHADLEAAQQREAAAVGAAGAAERLRRRAAAVAAACSRPADPAAAGVSPPASSPGDLLADVQQRLVGAARQLADHADASRDAAESCAVRYDALTTAK